MKSWISATCSLVIGFVTIGALASVSVTKPTPRWMPEDSVSNRSFAATDVAINRGVAIPEKEKRAPRVKVIPSATPRSVTEEPKFCKNVSLQQGRGIALYCDTIDEIVRPIPVVHPLMNSWKQYAGQR